MLTRDFIKHALYDATVGYFTAGTIIGGSGQALAFTDMLGRMEYLTTLDKLYAAARTGWLTPCEVFTPWYSHGLARHSAPSLSPTAPSTTPGLAGCWQTAVSWWRAVHHSRHTAGVTPWQPPTLPCARWLRG